MKKTLYKSFFVGFALLSGMMLAIAAQSPAAVNSSTNTSGYYAPQRLDANGNLKVVLNALSSDSTLLAVSGVPVVVKASSGRVVSINVISASGVGAIYDSATTASAVAATQIASIPATVGTYEINWPFFSGLVLNPSSSVISVNYN